MNSENIDLLDHDPEMQAVDLELSREFSCRPLQGHTSGGFLTSLQRMVRIFALPPEQMLRDIADAALELCGADSAGVSIEKNDRNGVPVFHWVATSGLYAEFLDAMLPRSRMPCRVSLETMRPQLLRVPGAYLTSLGMAAEAITDGMSIPWSVNGVRGTVWIVAHKRCPAFDSIDYEIMRSLADLTMAAVRNQGLLGQKSKADAAVALANGLALYAGNSPRTLEERTYLFRLEAPQPTVRVFVASTFEIHGDQLALLNRRGDLVALIVLDIIQDWCEVDGLFRLPDGSMKRGGRLNLC